MRMTNGLELQDTRLGSTEGEWPVAYHGTEQKNAHSIVCDGFLSSKGKRDQGILYNIVH